jgi:hypothetical protein
MILPPIFSSLNFTAELHPPESNQALIPVVGKIIGIEKIKEHDQQHKKITWKLQNRRKNHHY